VTRKKSRSGRPRATAQTPVPPPDAAQPLDTLPPPDTIDSSRGEAQEGPAPNWDAEATVDLTGGDIEEAASALQALRDDAAESDAAESDAPEEKAPPGDPEQAPASDDADEGTLLAEELLLAGGDLETMATEPPPDIEPARDLSEAHLSGLIEALVFASDKPLKANELARLASAPVKQVRVVLDELRQGYAGRGIVLDEVAGGWMFRTGVQYAPFVRELASERPVRLTRAQVETLAIVAYRQPITRPEVDDIRGVDSGATMKLLLERELVRILGKKDEPGRPILYGTTTAFLELFGLKSLKDLPTLKEFTELSEDSRRVAEAELGEVLPGAAPATPAEEHQATEGGPADEGEPQPHDEEAGAAEAQAPAGEAHAEPAEYDEDGDHDTVAPPAPNTDSELEDPP
jgi:segregation and condensation protein B